jgi:alpha-N-arabinofuranosidase
MKISRRSMLAGSAAAPVILKTGSASAASASIQIHSRRHRGEIDKNIFGNFIEHLGRCITGGIFDEGSPLSDARGFRKDVMTAVKDMAVPMLRWPGGNFSSNYDWRDGIGPRDKRPKRLEMAWGTVEDNRFGTHEFMDYVEAVGAEPYICLNLGTGTWADAQQWIEYVNGDQDTAITRQRRQNGRDKPWKVKYWGLGNEMDGYWQMGHRSASDYAAFALETAKLAKLTDPNVKLIAAGASNFRAGSDWIGWNRTVLEQVRDYADYISLHLYVGNTANDYADFVASPLEMDEKIEILEGLIAAAMAQRVDRVTGQPSRDGRKLYIAGRMERLVPRPRQWPAWPPHPGRALQSGGRAGGGRLPQLAGQSRRHGEDRQPGAAGECDRAHLHQRQGHVPADHLLSAAAFQQECERQEPRAAGGKPDLQEQAL